MSIDPTEATAAATTRRTFLARAAFGGALVGVATAGPLRSMLGVAGAQEAELDADEGLENDAFAALAVPLEMAAVQAYQAALETSSLDADTTTTARMFQTHHQTVVDALTPLLAEGSATPRPDETVMSTTVAAIEGNADQTAILTSLSELEDVLAATHLYAVGSLDDNSLAKTVAQVLAVESQQAVALGRAADIDLTELTPDEASTAGARTGFAEAAAAATTTTTTTTTEAGN
ncbi:MAG: ferritin-like domain-containing protein [Actinobacteria bacterium]|nr:ferritin-like domain-containing protein [Actinomycetota bacterium]